MAFLSAIQFYLVAILFYSISHCLPIERTEGFSTDWRDGSHVGYAGYKAAAPNFGGVCNSFQIARSQKLLCLLCNGFNPACLTPPTTPPTTPQTTPPTPTTVAATTTSTVLTSVNSIVTATAEADD